MPNPKPPASGGIVRRAHDRENPYVQISRALANDSTLSLEARGLMLYLLAKPVDWQIRMGDLQRAAGCGRDQMKRIMRELETAGYIVRTRSHSERGHWTWESMVHEVPQTPGEPSTENPSMVQPSMVGPSPDKAAIYKTESGLTNEIQIKEDTAGALYKNGSAPLPPDVAAALYLAADRYHLPADRVPWTRCAALVQIRGAKAIRLALNTATGRDWPAYWAAVEQG